MITPAARRERFLKEEGGFTLVEMMITTMMMIVVLLALYSIFDMSLRVFSVGNNKVEAVASARVGLEKMEREIRAAYPVNASASNLSLFFNANGSASNPPQQMPTQTLITFGNDLGAPWGEPGAADEVITCGTPCEYITYKLTDDSSGLVACTVAPCTLRRVNAANSADPAHQDSVVENVDPEGPNNGLTFQYLKSDGTTATNEGDIRMMFISLDISVDGGTYNPATQTLTTMVDLRNR
jgi:type II secretory pathway pseudopilin PulG